MARLEGGIFSAPRGSTGGVTFGAARTRTGKVVTARAKTSPSNPNTVPQQEQRNVFRDSLDIVKALGPTIYQDDWNRSVGQLPGFHSMQSIMLNNLTSAGGLNNPDDVALGDLSAITDLAFAAGAASGDLDVTWTPNNGSNGTDADEIVMLAIPSARANRDPVAAVVATASRVDGAATIAGLVAGVAYVVGVYARGAGTAAGLLSLAVWDGGFSKA